MTNSPFVIKQINMFSGWVYNLPKNNECTICRCNLNTPSLYNQEKGIDSYVVSGTCLHSFHQECIKPWVDKNKHCPICSVQWQYNYPNNEKLESSHKIKDKESDSDLPPLINIDNNININENIKININKDIDNYKNMKLNIDKYMIKQQDNVIDKIIYSNNSNNENKKIKIIKKIMDSKIDNFINEEQINNSSDKDKLINIFKKEGEQNKTKKIFDLGDDDNKKNLNNPEDDYDIVD
jgi:hypothetical protein